MPEKCFNFKIVCEVDMIGYVFAKNEEEALNAIMNYKCDEVSTVSEPKIIKIEKLEEDGGIKNVK